MDSKDPSPITVVTFEARDVESGVLVWEGEICRCATGVDAAAACGGVNGGKGVIGVLGCFLSDILD